MLDPTAAAAETFEHDMELVAHLATGFMQAASEKEIYTRLGEGLRQVIGDDAIISVNNYEPGSDTFAPKVLVGLGSFAEKMIALIAKRPIDLGGDYPPAVKRAMTLGRLTRVEGGVVELAGHVIPPVICRQAVALFGLNDVYVVGFAKGDFAGGVCIVCRRPAMVLRHRTIEALARLAAASIERKRAQEKLRDSEELHRVLFETSHDALMTLGPPSWNFVSCNRATVEMFRVRDQAEFTLLDPGALSPAEQPDGRHSGEKARSMIEKALREGSHAFEWTHRRADGETFPAEVLLTRMERGGQASLQATVRDITERKRADEELQKLAAVVKHSSELVNLSDPEGRMVFLNEAGARMLGIAPEDVKQTNIMQVIPDHLREEVERDLFPALMAGGVWKGELQYLNLKTGGLTDVHAIAFAITDPSLGSTRYFANVSRDITERKRAEEQNAKLQAQLHQAQKMESVGRLAGGVAHDFNNMLGVILGNVDMALEQLDPSHPLHADLEEIRTAAARSANLTRQLLAFARKQVIAPKVLDLNETVEGMLKMLRRLIGEDIDLVWRPAASLWPVKVDPSQIDQILANLCVNARDAIGGVGKLTIETANSTFDEDYCASHADVVPGEYVSLAVSDDGCGMDKETVSHLFEPFFTTKGVGNGTGLGLATVYGIVKQNGGFNNVHSESDKGTTFTIYLPRHAARPQLLQSKVPAAQAVRGHETVLLVEDEPAILKMTERMLERQGYTVLTASTPGEAIRLATEHSGEIHLLMTDVVMPEMNGRDLARNLLALYPEIKRLFMSGYTANVIAHHGEGLHFIQKPFSQQELAEKVREALEPGG